MIRQRRKSYDDAIVKIHKISKQIFHPERRGNVAEKPPKRAKIKLIKRNEHEQVVSITIV